MIFGATWSYLVCTPAEVSIRLSFPPESRNWTGFLYEILIENADARNGAIIQKPS